VDACDVVAGTSLGRNTLVKQESVISSGFGGISELVIVFKETLQSQYFVKLNLTETLTAVPKGVSTNNNTFSVSVEPNFGIVVDFSFFNWLESKSVR
jgi:hypothetical protein